MATSQFNELFISVFGTETGIHSRAQMYNMLMDHYEQKAANAEAVASYEQKLKEFMKHDVNYLSLTSAIYEKSDKLIQLETELAYLGKTPELMEKQRASGLKQINLDCLKKDLKYFAFTASARNVLYDSPPYICSRLVPGEVQTPP
jgi:hypothetical protein